MKKTLVMQCKSKKIRSLRKNYDLYLMLVPVIAFYVVFKYIPMYGIQIAFREYNPGLGFSASPFVGWDNFERFFSSYRFSRMIYNSIAINLLQVLFQFPIPILFAILVNELRKGVFKGFVLNLTYIPHFLSTVVVIALVENICNPEYGIINEIIKNLGGESIRFMESAKWFKPVYIISGIWQNAGWSAIIYIAALTSISPDLYEAAKIDGANKWQLIRYIDIPGIAPTAIMMLILEVGKIMNIGFQKAYLLQNSLNITASEIIPTYIYKIGLIDTQYSYSAAISLFNNIVNIILLVSVNKIAQKTSESSLW